MRIETGGIEKRLHLFRSAAREAGVKLTHQRLEIFRVVTSRADHPSAEAVYHEVRATVPTVSLDTVYRTLRLLTEIGLLTTLGIRQDSVRFDANTENHHHFVCIRCGLVRDVEGAKLKVSSIPASVRDFGEILSAHVEVRGVCRECANEPKAASFKKPKPPQGKKRSRS